MLNGSVCLTVDYVEGHETPPRCFVKLTCTTENEQIHPFFIEGTSGCVDIVTPHISCNLTAIDGDAMEYINTTAPVTITGISVPSYTVAPSTISTTSTPTGCTI